jgi:hypothetical protein
MHQPRSTRLSRHGRMLTAGFVGVLLLAGCSDRPGVDNPASTTPAATSPTNATSNQTSAVSSGGGSAVDQLEATVAACASAPQLDVAVVDGEIFAETDTLTVDADSSVVVVVQTDAAVDVNLPGSVSPTNPISTGVASICTRYLSSGTFYVDVDRRVAATVTVTDGSAPTAVTDEPIEGLVE